MTTTPPRKPRAGSGTDALGKAISAVIRERMSSFGVSGNQLSQVIGFPQPTVARWVRGGSVPGTKELSLIARALGTTGGAILGEAERRVAQDQLNKHA